MAEKQRWSTRFVGYLKLNKFKLIAISVWVMGIPLSILLSYFPTQGSANTIKYIFSARALLGYMLLFISLGIVALYFAMILEGKKFRKLPKPGEEDNLAEAEEFVPVAGPTYAYSQQAEEPQPAYQEQYQEQQPTYQEEPMQQYQQYVEEEQPAEQYIEEEQFTPETAETPYAETSFYAPEPEAEPEPEIIQEPEQSFQQFEEPQPEPEVDPAMTAAQSDIEKLQAEIDAIEKQLAEGR